MKKLVDVVKVRSDRLENARKVLKEKFVGIDKQIDNIVDRITFWYLYPQKMRRPLIVNLWGPTGVGKTDLIRTLRDLLDLKGSFAEYMMSSAEDTTTSRDLCDKVHEEHFHLTQGEPGILVLDEFQRYRTKDGNGAPIRNLPYQDIWQVLSDGKVIKNIKKQVFDECMELFNWSPSEGFAVNLNYRSSSDLQTALKSFSEKVLKQQKGKRKTPEEIGDDSAALAEVLKDENKSELVRQLVAGHRLNETTLEIQQRKLTVAPAFLKKLCSSFKFRDPENTPFFYEHIHGNVYLTEHLATAGIIFGRIRKLLIQYGFPCGDTVEDILEAIGAFTNSAEFKQNQSEYVNYSFDLSKLLIFVVGNLDEVYKESLHTDSPFVPADVYRQWCNDISIYDVKENLGKMYFPEQVARLGNTHVVYPTLGAEHYRELIRRGLVDIENDLLIDGFKVKIDPSVAEFVYRNGVYPVQGVRPVFTSIQEIANSVVTLAHMASTEKKTVVSYDNYRIRLSDPSFKGKGVLSELLLVGDRDRVAKALREDPQWINLVAIHEVGHALLDYSKGGNAPLFCVIQHEGGVTVPRHIPMDTAEILWARVQSCLAGVVANNTLLGPRFVGGHTSDLSKATDTLISLIRRYGMKNILSLWSNGNDLEGGRFGNETICLTPSYTVLGVKEVDDDVLVLDGTKEEALVNKCLEKAQKQVMDIVQKYQGAIKEAAEILVREMYMSGDDLEAVFVKHQVPKADVILKPKKADNSITG